MSNRAMAKRQRAGLSLCSTCVGFVNGFLLTFLFGQASNIAPEVNSLVFCFYLEVDKPHLDLIWPCDHIQYLMRLLPSGRGAQLAASTTCGILHIFPVQYMFHPNTLWINGEGRWFACLTFLRGIAGRCEMKPGTLSCCFAE